VRQLQEKAGWDHCWHTFDARYNVPRLGRVLIMRSSNASDVAMITSFDGYQLSSSMSGPTNTTFTSSIRIREAESDKAFHCKEAGLKTRVAANG
jgi:hypothetical protein